MILVDSNIPMYLVGAAHANKDRARVMLERLIMGGEVLITDAEVLQEILHRYVAIDRRDAIQPAFDALLGVVERVFAISDETVDLAKRIVLGSRSLSARDAIHIAVMEQQGVDRLFSFDSGFDEYPALDRIS
jgi:predicted nucleic acid-binding protein